MADRKLATIQTISKLEPIDGADNIEKASILGWSLVVKKGEFKVGDNCVYCEIDSFLPIRPEFEFLRKSSLRKLEDGTEGFRIRTVRLRKTVSQGIAFPRIILTPEQFSKLKVGDDVTELLGVLLWQPPIPADLKGKIKGRFPMFMPKTDETRVQLLQSVITRHRGSKCYITEKLDGSSATYYLKDGEFGVCSRNLELLETADNAFWKVAREMKIEEKMKQYSVNYGWKNFAIQGELVGQGIQDNRLQIQGRKVYFFSMFDIDKFEYKSYVDFIMIVKGIMDLPIVPILRDDFILIDDIPKLIEFSIAKSLINPKIWREGIVIRPLAEKMDMQMSNEFNNGRVSFKVINPEYLIEYEE